MPVGLALDYRQATRPLSGRPEAGRPACGGPDATESRGWEPAAVLAAGPGCVSGRRSGAGLARGGLR